MNIMKIRDSPFSLFTVIDSKELNLGFYIGQFDISKYHYNSDPTSNCLVQEKAKTNPRKRGSRKGSYAF